MCIVRAPACGAPRPHYTMPTVPSCRYRCRPGQSEALEDAALHRRIVAFLPLPRAREALFQLDGMPDAVEIDQLPGRRRRGPPGTAHLKRPQQCPAAPVAPQHMRLDLVFAVRQGQFQPTSFANGFLDGVE